MTLSDLFNRRRKEEADGLDSGLRRARVLERTQDMFHAIRPCGAERLSRGDPDAWVGVLEASERRFQRAVGRSFCKPLKRCRTDFGGRV